MSSETAEPDVTTTERRTDPLRRDGALDGLRGLAALLIMLLHYLPTLDPVGLPSALQALLRTSFIGVDLFFVLSGFLIGRIVFRHSSAPNFLRVFFARRALRILPLYVAVLLAAGIAGALARPPWLAIFQPDLPLWCYLLFVHNLAPIVLSGVQVPSPWLSTAWSLAVEEHFYLLSPLIAVWSSPRWLIRGAIAVLLLSPVLRYAGTLAGAGALHLYTATPFRLDALAAGVLVAALDQRVLELPRGWRWPASTRLAMVAMLAVVIGIAIDNPAQAHSSVASRCLSYSAIALAASLLLAALVTEQSVLRRLLQVAPLRAAGTWAYGLYLLHVPVLWLTHAALRGRPPSLDDAGAKATTALAAVLAVLAAAGSWYGLEHRCIRIGHRLRYDLRCGQAAA